MTSYPKESTSGGPYSIAVIGGDGIGPEVLAEALKVVAAAGVKLETSDFELGAAHYLRTGEVLPDETLSQLRGFDAILLGAIGPPIGSKDVPSGVLERGLLLRLRFELDLYVNLRPFNGSPSSIGEGCRFAVVRENTEGPYVSMGGRFKPGTAEEVATETDINTYRGVERVQRYAFELARRRPRHRLHLADKANALVHAGALWRRVFTELQPQFPEVAATAMYVDAMALQLVREPAQFDVIVTNNLFGDILTDLAAALQGGLGMAASANLHPSPHVGGPPAAGGGPGLFEPVHGSAPAIAGKDQANPMGAILSGA
ncbi:MAG: isocitrate/isopropylmalate dehydrogenase family protein, partial [Acidimicrobiales bacterium]